MQNKKERKEKRKCLECKKFIDLSKDHYVLLATINRSKSPDEFVYFHINCWVDYFNKRVENKMRENVKFMQEKALSVFNSPEIKPLLNDIMGSQVAMNMLQIPLDTNKVITTDKILKVLKKNGNRKKRATERKDKMQ